MDIQSLFEKSAEFHGHRCPGLAIGVRAAVEAQNLLGIGHSADEEIVCITENDACGVDGIQVLLGCSAGKGNLIFRIRGKQAYSFFNRTSVSVSTQIVIGFLGMSFSSSESVRLGTEANPPRTDSQINSKSTNSFIEPPRNRGESTSDTASN